MHTTTGVRTLLYIMVVIIVISQNHAKLSYSIINLLYVNTTNEHAIIEKRRLLLVA